MLGAHPKAIFGELCPLPHLLNSARSGNRLPSVMNGQRGAEIQNGHPHRRVPADLSPLVSTGVVSVSHVTGWRNCEKLTPGVSTLRRVGRVTCWKGRGAQSEGMKRDLCMLGTNTNGIVYE